MLHKPPRRMLLLLFHGGYSFAYLARFFRVPRSFVESQIRKAMR